MIGLLERLIRRTPAHQHEYWPASGRAGRAPDQWGFACACAAEPPEGWDGWTAAHVRADYRVFDGLRKGWGLQVDWWSGGISDRGNDGQPKDRGSVERPARVTGFEPGHRPVAGDLFHTAMQSGRTLLWLVVSAEHMRDPDDMYGADLFALGYEDELGLPASTDAGAGSDWV